MPRLTLSHARPAPRWIVPLLLAVAMPGCSDIPSAETPDALHGELADANVAGIGAPIVASALQAPLMSDPTLSQSANADTIRPPSRPDPESVPIDDPVAATAGSGATATAAPCPDCTAVRAALTPVALVAAQRAPAITACAPRLGYTADWANRLPTGLALYPDAHVAEAAGTDDGGCHIRVVRFTSNAAPASLVDWYRGAARAGGWAASLRADGPMQALSGQRPGARFDVYATLRGPGGSDVVLLVAGG